MELILPAFISLAKQKCRANNNKLSILNEICLFSCILTSVIAEINSSKAP